VNTTVLRLYMHEARRCHGQLLYDWLLTQAAKLGIAGGSAFRAVAGYGRHGVLLEQRFFELAGEVPVVTEFIVSAEEAEQMLALLRSEAIDLFYVRWSAESGTTIPSA
jgi:PII-like signaling protein